MSKTKNLLERAVAAILAVAMALVLLPANALAADTTTYKLTLTGTATGHTYEAYQIFTGDLATGTDGTKTLSNVKWGSGVTYTGTETASEVAEKLAKNEMTISDLEGKLTLTTPVKTVASSKDSTVIDGLASGYYLVKDKDGTQDNTSDAYTKFIVQVVGDTSTAVKSSVPTVTKKVQDNTNGQLSDWQDSADWAINEWVPFQITGTMPSTIADYSTYKYVFTDTMSKGLTYDGTDATHKATIKIYSSAADTTGINVTSSFTEATETKTDGSTVVTWTINDLKSIPGVTLTATSRVVVTYSAKLNVNANIGSEGNPNTVNLTYSNNPNSGGEGETGKTPDDKNIVFTYKTIVNKVDQDGTTPLAGAGFTLQKKNADGTYTDVQTISAEHNATTFTFSGLDDGDYKLIESTTPAGYNTMTPVEFTITATHEEESDDPKLLTLSGSTTTGEATWTADKNAGSLTTSVVNKRGSVLPSTGGAGTTMLYVGGATLAAAAAFGIYQLRKKDNEA
ncbi:MAG: isopeptide-forming domain-containing fimbrial protein [Atopobiaceae bacterium]